MFVRKLSLSLPLLCLVASSALAGAPTFGPGSPAWGEDLAALRAAFQAGAPDLDARIKEFGSTHYILQSTFRLRRAAGETRRMADGRSDTPNPLPDRGRYAVDGLCQTKFELEKYGKKLARYLPRVDSGEKSLDWARKKARPLNPFSEAFGLEVADTKTETGVMVSTPRWDIPTLEIYRPGTWKPNGWTMMKTSWRDMNTRIVLNREYDVVEIDRDEPQEGYKSLIEALRVLGELAPTLPSENPDELVTPPDPE
jgi:hypothetical protein